ncbi:hypothetical protein Pint_09836 [Pistacia integerrima]|uniref:Uncharacterized protein n=1 Tax=Pistacia integerrima TaxID=434235 RepID=A0ACC0XK43_9ROSI|nr:hypothetical protein Pint_09836 [Pistacia integerrima]
MTPIGSFSKIYISTFIAKFPLSLLLCLWDSERMGSCSAFFLVAALMVTVEVSIGVKEVQLAYDYYKHSCPSLEAIVKKEILSISFFDASAPAAFLRLLFHDCQVQGCDASILLDYDGLIHDSEMVSSKNFGVRHREKIQHIKTILEAVCPGQVSCADIIALAAREAVSVSGGPQIQIPLGRKDSTTCNHQQANTHLPSSGITVDQLLPIFSSKGMNLKESYYRDILMGKGLFGVDSSLSRDPRTAAIVHKFAYDKNYFFQAFSSAFVKLSSTNVLTNAKGELGVEVGPI